jgi:SAM-dependent methyltransferase
MHGIVCRYSDRRQNHSTFFLRNRPELALICGLLTEKPSGSQVDIAVIGCSNGAEVYSVVWAIRSSRPDLKINLQAVDISQPILNAAEQGIYPHSGTQGQRFSMFMRMTAPEMNAMFEMSHGEFRIRPYLKHGIHWVRGDAADPGLATTLGPQDLVIANRFLCHMKPTFSEACLRNVSRSVKPGGYLGISGIDLDIRTKVARDLKWKPVMELIAEVHEGDPSLTESWPCSYWGLEPFSTSVPDWAIRYASFFQIGSVGAREQVHDQFLGSLVNPSSDDVVDSRPISGSSTYELSGAPSNV